MRSINHVAVVVAAVLFFALGAGWYNLFSQPWLDGIGKTVEQIAKDNGGSPLPFVVGFRRDPGHVLHARAGSCSAAWSRRPATAR